MDILGISALYHDSAACLLRDGEIIAAVQEERFTRLKHDSRMPENAISYCLAEGGLPSAGNLDAAVFYDKPLSKLVRLLDTYTETSPRGLKSFLMAIPAWLKQKAFIPKQVEEILKSRGVAFPKKFYFAEHHVSHAASAFYPSPFEKAAIVTLDGVGEWATTAVGEGEGHNIKLLYENRFPHSIGLLYSTFTYYTGFRVNSGEYKLMGLAPYGEPVYVDRIRDNLVDIREDGSYRLNMKYFGYLDGLTMTTRNFERLFEGLPRRPESPISQKEMDLARSVQAVAEEIIFNTARYARAVTGKPNLCLAGGVALNCVANGKLLASGIFDDIWIQPAAGDAGGALGAAFYVWHQLMGNDRKKPRGGDSMKNALLGPSFKPEKTKSFLDDNGFVYEVVEDEDERAGIVAGHVAEGRVVGLFQGRMEFGPRALCNRSIIADARSRTMQSHLNLATKFRESFRPFAPVVLEEDAAEYFEMNHDSPYMLLVAPVKKERRLPVEKPADQADIRQRVNIPRSDVPAITHVDFSARVQTVNRDQNPFAYSILQKFKAATGCSLVVNTSFNVRGEPIVCTPEDACRCFMRTGMDVLVLDKFILLKNRQPERKEQTDWKEDYVLD